VNVESNYSRLDGTGMKITLEANKDDTNIGRADPAVCGRRLLADRRPVSP
jgi:hypothetical protein